MENLWIDQSSSLDAAFIAAAIILLFCIVGLLIAPQDKSRKKKKKSKRDGVNSLLTLCLILSSVFVLQHTHEGTRSQIEHHFGIHSLTSDITPHCTPFSPVIDTTAQWKEGDHWFSGKLVIEKRGVLCEVAVTAFENPQSKLLDAS